MESRFADIIWNNEPLSTAKLVELCAGELAWKRTTTYTVLKRLCERGIFQNINSTVTSRISRDDFYSNVSEHFVEENFSGSLPAFIAAFTKNKRLSEDEIDQIRNLIEDHALRASREA
ncbi:MAG: BlaI/MecI/CopY family transcriptional regulator [Lachnospiraceae bacterium]|nr:BlaI/MecI/CopY family transcriptional regulator [Lachnospiraceae bacterium]